MEEEAFVCSTYTVIQSRKLGIMGGTCFGANMFLQIALRHPAKAGGQGRERLSSDDIEPDCGCGTDPSQF